MTLAQILGLVRRRWPVLVVGILLGALAGWQLAARVTPEYRSTATVFFSLDRGSSVNEFTAGTTYAQDLVPSYARIVPTPVVLEPVIADLGLPVTPEQLAGQVAAVAQPNTVLLDITVTDASPTGAATIANATATELARVVATLSPRGGPDAPRIRVTTTSPALPAATPASTSPSLLRGVGVAAGLLLGLLVAVLLELRARPVRNRAALAAVTSAPLLGSIVRDRRARQSPIPTVTDPRSARAERFRILRANLHLGPRTQGSRCVVVTSAVPREGRTAVAVNLAIALAGTGQRVLLVDADLRSPGVAPMLGIDGSQGLSAVLSQGTKIGAVVRRWGAPGGPRMDVLPGGRPPANPDELLSSSAMTTLLQNVRVNYDIVVVDTPPLLPVADAGTAAGLVGSALLVVDARRTRRAQVAEAVDRLQMAGARVTGVVLNKVPGRRLRYSVAGPSRPEVAHPAATADSDTTEALEMAWSGSSRAPASAPGPQAPAPPAVNGTSTGPARSAPKQPGPGQPGPARQGPARPGPVRRGSSAPADPSPPPPHTLESDTVTIARKPPEFGTPKAAAANGAPVNGAGPDPAGPDPAAPDPAAPDPAGTPTTGADGSEPRSAAADGAKSGAEASTPPDDTAPATASTAASPTPVSPKAAPPKAVSAEPETVWLESRPARSDTASDTARDAGELPAREPHQPADAS